MGSLPLYFFLLSQYGGIKIRSLVTGCVIIKEEFCASRGNGSRQRGGRATWQATLYYTELPILDIFAIICSYFQRPDQYKMKILVFRTHMIFKYWSISIQSEEYWISIIMPKKLKYQYPFWKKSAKKQANQAALKN